MKTPDEILKDCSPNPDAGYEKSWLIDAMKLYAKACVHEMALQSFHYLDARDYNTIISELQPDMLKKISDQ